MARKPEDYIIQMFKNAGLELTENEIKLIFSQGNTLDQANLVTIIYSAKLNDRSAKKLETTTKVVARATVVLAVFTGLLAYLTYLQLYAVP